MKNRIVIGFLAGIMTLLLLAGCQNDSPQTQVVAVAQGEADNKPAPDFTLWDVNGQSVSLAQFKGQVVVLNFWATWCPPCREEMPSMEALHRKFADKGLVMIAVNVEENGPEVVPDFLKSHPYTFKILYDVDAKVQNSYRVYRYPETFIIDRNGHIVERVVGSQDWTRGPAYKLIDFLLNG